MVCYSSAVGTTGRRHGISMKADLVGEKCTWCADRIAATQTPPAGLVHDLRPERVKREQTRSKAQEICLEDQVQRLLPRRDRRLMRAKNM